MRAPAIITPSPTHRAGTGQMKNPATKAHAIQVLMRRD